VPKIYKQVRTTFYMKRGERVKAVIFDVGGVLALSQNPVKIKNHLHTIGVHEFIANKLKISIDQYFDSIEAIYSKSMQGSISKKKVLSSLTKNLNMNSKKIEKLYIQAYKKNFNQNKTLYKKAFKLKKQGYKIAILSDQWHLSKGPVMLEKYFKRFDVAIASCDIGMRKPNPKIYKLVLNKLKIKPPEAIFIDNQEWNIKPAKKLGIKTILFKDNKQLFKDLEKFGVN